MAIEARVIATIVDLLVSRRGDSIRSIYLFGSYHDGTALDTSDVDLAIVTDEPSRDVLLDLLKADLAAAGIMGVDIILFDYDQLIEAGHFRIERGTRLLFGEDVRPRLPPTTLDAYLRRYGQGPVNYMTDVLRRRHDIQPPLGYPDPDGELFGYDRDVLPPGGRRAHNVKAMVSCACWIASMLVGIRTGRMTTTKPEAIRAYQEAIADGWTPLVTEMYASGRQRWHYLVPQDPAERRQLRSRCQRMLSLERHYLDVYTAFLRSLASQSEEDADYASEVLVRIGCR
jgi:predicted nucleotidyltransferase